MPGRLAWLTSSTRGVYRLMPTKEVVGKVLASRVMGWAASELYRYRSKRCFDHA